jgi:integrase
MVRRNLAVSRLKPQAKAYLEPDPQTPGLYVRVLPSGAKSYLVVTRAPGGKQVWHTVGSTALIDIEDAREKAREVIKAIKSGASRAGPQSFESVARDFIKRHVEPKGLRSQDAIERYFSKHILPEWGTREFTSIRRADVAKLLDSVEDKAGPVAADYTLAVVSKITRWYATRDNDYVSPVVPGMRRSSPKERARDRILDDDEIRAIWQQAEANGTFGAIIRILLLTGQRKEKVASMRWQDVSINGVWTIPSERREKGNAGTLALPDIAVEIIKSRPRFDSNPYVFAGRGESHFGGHSKAKAAFDAKLALGKRELPQWQLHDLRRTARSLMARAGVRPDIAERTLGHVIKGVAGTYDRHSYKDEKAMALRKLAALVETIINAPAANVVHIAR